VDWTAEPSLKVVLPPAQYDLISTYLILSSSIDGGILVKEALSLESTLAVELDEKEIVHRVKFQPTYPAGSPHGSAQESFTLVRHKSSGIAVPILSGVQFLASPVSDAYSLEFVMINDGTELGRPFYTFNGFLPAGLQGPVTFENKATDFRHVRLDHSLRMGNRAADYLTLVDLDRVRAVVSITKTGTREFYLALPPSPDFRSGQVGQMVYERDGPGLYQTARWRPASSSVIESYAWGDNESPLASTASDFLPAAVGPYYWFGRFQNRTDQIRIGASFGGEGVLLRGQCGDYYRQAGFTYEISPALTAAARSTYEELLPSVLPVTPGQYTMVISLPDASRPGAQDTVTARFDTTKSDPNPPYLTGFRFLKREEFSEVFSAGQPRALWFRAADDKELGRVELWLDSQKITITSQGKGEYQAELPALGSAASAQLRLEMEDSSANLLRFETTISAASADLGITAAGRDKALVGRTARFDVKVSNLGFDSTDSKITLTETLPKGLSLVSATGDHWSCTTSGDTVSCERNKPVYAKTESLLSLFVGIGREAYPSVSTRFEVDNKEDQNPNNNISQLSAGVDGNAWWTAVGPFGGDVYSLAGDPSNPDVLYASVCGQIYKSNSRGVSWAPVSKGLPGAVISTLAIHPQNTKILYGGTDGYGVWKSTDGGLNWSALKSGLFDSSTVLALRFDPSSPETLYCGHSGGAARSTDGGSSWTRLNLGPASGTVSDIAVHPQLPSTVYAGAETRIYLSTDKGTTWRVSLNLLGSPATGLLGGPDDPGNHGKWMRLAFDPDDPSTLWANTIMSLRKTTDGGNTWQRITLSAPAGFYPTAISIARDPQRTIYLATQGGIWRSTDRGTSWLRLPLEESGFIDDVLIGADGAVFVSNSAGVHESLDKGDTWLRCGEIAGVQARALVVDPNHPGSLLAGTSIGLVAGSSGGDWLSMDGTFQPTLLVADRHHPGTYYASASGLWKSTDSGRTWVTSFNRLEDDIIEGIVFSALVQDPKDPAILYIATRGKSFAGQGVFKSTDAGASWAPANTGLYPEVDCLAIDPDSGHLFAGLDGVPGSRFALHRSVDGAASWVRVGEGLPKARIKVLAFTGTGPSRNLFLGTEGAGVYRSDDDGANWKPVGSGLPEGANVTAIAADSAGTLYVGTYGGGVFLSSNGGDSWSALAEGLTSPWINALVLDPNDPRSLYVATSTGVFGISLAPDFGVSVQRTAKLLAGGAGLWGVTVKNTGSATSREEMAVTLSMPPGFRLLKSSGSGWNCLTSADTVRCSSSRTVEREALAPLLGLVFEIDDGAAGSEIARIAVDSPEDMAPGNDGFLYGLDILPTAVSRLSLFKSEPGGFLGLALSNGTTKRTDVVLTALDTTGKLIDLPQNPAFLTLDPGVQLAKLSSEVFGEPAGATREGWIRVAAQEPIGTMFQYGGEGKLDGGDGAARPEKVLYFTRACQGGAACSGFSGKTLLNLVNPNSTAVTVTTVLSANPPSWGDRKVTKVIPAKGALTSSVSDLFGVSSVKTSFIKLEVLDGEGIVGSQLIELTETGSLVSLPAQTVGPGDRLYSAQLADVPGLFTSLKLVNASSQSRTIRVTAIDDNGEALAVPKELQLDAERSVEENCRSWLDWLPGKDRIGSLIVESDGPGLIGSVLFGSSSGETAAALPLESEPAGKLTFSQVANTSGVYTGLALFNPGSSAIDATIRVFTAEGSTSGETTVSLKPGTRVSKLLTELVPQTEGQVGGYVTLTATGPIVAQELFGGPGFLSAVPAAK